MTLIEFVFALGFFGFLIVQFIVLVMIGLLGRRITKLEKQEVSNYTYWKGPSRNRPDEQAFVEQSWND